MLILDIIFGGALCSFTEFNPDNPPRDIRKERDTLERAAAEEIKRKHGRRPKSHVEPADEVMLVEVAR